ncbi:glycoside hydrolase family 27 protein [Tsukamurella sp. NPDC003166]|uniref:glycoside hydrolase family 27 protein n=1 Tax=Tsukamurella sp. NPDC003166 TaxID=3154444 RepID=UPI0033AC94C4
MRHPLVPCTVAAVLVAAGCAAPHVPSRPAVPPTLGWDSWNLDGCTVTAARVERQADALISSGLADAGYRTVIVDDCWFAPDRTGAGELTANPRTFPGGIPALADRLHAQGLELGIYESPGDRTCAQQSGAYPGSTGSAGHEEQDARTFADWGVDYLKYDWCGPGVPAELQRETFRRMRDALAATGRRITYAINPNSGVAGDVPGATGTWAGIADAVRVTNDVVPAWRTGAPATENQGIADVLDRVPPDPGTVRDLDMLVAGLPGVTEDQGRTQITQWARLRSPLIITADIATLSTGTVDLLRRTAHEM